MAWIFLYLYKYIRQWQMKIGILKNVLCDLFITNSCLCGIETKTKSQTYIHLQLLTIREAQALWQELLMDHSSWFERFH